MDILFSEQGSPEPILNKHNKQLKKKKKKGAGGY